MNVASPTESVVYPVVNELRPRLRGDAGRRPDFAGTSRGPPGMGEEEGVAREQPRPRLKGVADLGGDMWARFEGLVQGMESRLTEKIDGLGERLDRVEEHIGLSRQPRGRSRYEEERDFMDRVAELYAEEPVHDTRVPDTIHVSEDEEHPDIGMQSQDMMDPPQLDEVQTDVAADIEVEQAHEVPPQLQDMMPPPVQHGDEGASMTIVLLGCASAPLDEDVSMAEEVQVEAEGVEEEARGEVAEGVQEEDRAEVAEGVQEEAEGVEEEDRGEVAEGVEVAGASVGGDEGAQGGRRYNLRRRDQGGPQTAQKLISPYEPPRKVAKVMHVLPLDVIGEAPEQTVMEFNT